ncbi:hypothetical protein ND861_04895 [Leptospira sp. 2 VSF19]|nr:hypothetical protein [Leptospira soteropolitanensis]MCW7491988.1 hypothetical protein [Leptospira soteropolitanensis]MCW7525675.1 hypothetical protein [Leptospira soteropolitanensis]
MATILSCNFHNIQESKTKYPELFKLYSGKWFLFEKEKSYEFPKFKKNYSSENILTLSPDGTANISTGKLRCKEAKWYINENKVFFKCKDIDSFQLSFINYERQKKEYDLYLTENQLTLFSIELKNQNDTYEFYGTSDIEKWNRANDSFFLKLKEKFKSADSYFKYKWYFFESLHISNNEFTLYSEESLIDSITKKNEDINFKTIFESLNKLESILTNQKLELQKQEDCQNSLRKQNIDFNRIEEAFQKKKKSRDYEENGQLILSKNSTKDSKIIFDEVFELGKEISFPKSCNLIKVNFRTFAFQTKQGRILKFHFVTDTDGTKGFYRESSYTKESIASEFESKKDEEMIIVKIKLTSGILAGIGGEKITSVDRFDSYDDVNLIQINCQLLQVSN